MCVDGCRVGGGEGGWATAADAEKFDLGHDEAVAATVLAHDHVRVSLSNLERSVDLVGVVVCADVLER